MFYLKEKLVGPSISVETNLIILQNTLIKMKLFNNEFLNLPTLKRSKLLFFIAASFSSIIVSSEPTYSQDNSGNNIAKCKDLTLPSLISDGGRVNGGRGCTTVSYTHLTLPTNREV